MFNNVDFTDFLKSASKDDKTLIKNVHLLMGHGSWKLLCKTPEKKWIR